MALPGSKIWSLAVGFASFFIERTSRRSCPVCCRETWWKRRSFLFWIIFFWLLKYGSIGWGPEKLICDWGWCCWVQSRRGWRRWDWFFTFCLHDIISVWEARPVLRSTSPATWFSCVFERGLYLPFRRGVLRLRRAIWDCGRWSSRVICYFWGLCLRVVSTWNWRSN